VRGVALGLLKELVGIHSFPFLAEAVDLRHGGVVNPAEALVAADEVGGNEEDGDSHERGGDEKFGFADGTGDRNGQLTGFPRAKINWPLTRLWRRTATLETVCGADCTICTNCTACVVCNAARAQDLEVSYSLRLPHASAIS